MSLEQSLRLLAQDHFPNAPCPDPELRESRFALPDDLREFYHHHDGAKLFDRIDCPYRILRLRELCHPVKLIWGEDERPAGTEDWVTFCELHDGNYLCYELAEDGRTSVILDCFHETFHDPEYRTVIEASFSDFLANALASEGFQYWLGR